jgi:hypothetical protein
MRIPNYCAAGRGALAGPGPSFAPAFFNSATVLS